MTSYSRRLNLSNSFQLYSIYMPVRLTSIYQAYNSRNADLGSPGPLNHLMIKEVNIIPDQHSSTGTHEEPQPWMRRYNHDRQMDSMVAKVPSVQTYHDEDTYICLHHKVHGYPPCISHIKI